LGGGNEVPAIELINVSKFFGRIPAVLEASLKVEEGEFFGFIGPNGSGKTTTIRMMMDFLRPTSGAIRLFGMDARSQSVEIKKQVGYVPAEMDFCGGMRAGELLHYAAALRGVRDDKTMDDLCECFEVDMGRRVCRMSLGNRKKIALVLALYAHPRLLILDEATVGLDALVRKRFLDRVMEEQKNGATVFFCSHDLGEIQQLCSRMALIRRGSILKVDRVGAVVDDLRSVCVKTAQDITPMLKLFHIADAVKDGDRFRFSFQGSMDTLVKALAYYRIDDIQIEKPTLEHAILRLYEQKAEQEAGA
jgi:ABC-2 type transport system ATP-binding protein